MNIFETIKHLNWRKVNVFGCVESYLTDYRNDESRIKKVSTYRLKICANCHMNNNGTCDNSGNRKIVNIDTAQEVVGCGCNIKCKSCLLSSNCPAGLWKSIID
jgi:hypothetical protein